MPAKNPAGDIKKQFKVLRDQIFSVAKTGLKQLSRDVEATRDVLLNTAQVALDRLGSTFAQIVPPADGLIAHLQQQHNQLAGAVREEAQRRITALQNQHAGLVQNVQKTAEEKVHTLRAGLDRLKALPAAELAALDREADNAYFAAMLQARILQKAWDVTPEALVEAQLALMRAQDLLREKLQEVET